MLPQGSIPRADKYAYGQWRGSDHRVKGWCGSRAGNTVSVEGEEWYHMVDVQLESEQWKYNLA